MKRDFLIYSLLITSLCSCAIHAADNGQEEKEKTKITKKYAWSLTQKFKWLVTSDRRHATELLKSGDFHAAYDDLDKDKAAAQQHAAFNAGVSDLVAKIKDDNGQRFPQLHTLVKLGAAGDSDGQRKLALSKPNLATVTALVQNEFETCTKLLALLGVTNTSKEEGKSSSSSSSSSDDNDE